MGNNEYTRDEGFLEGLWYKFFSTRLKKKIMPLFMDGVQLPQG